MRILTVFGQQALVRSALKNFTLVYHDYLRCRPHC
jgi:hypothetical protein